MSESKQSLYEAYDYSKNPTWRRIFIFLAYLPLSYIGISALYLYFQWDKIPDQIPGQYGMFSNQVTAWAGKGLGEVYPLLIVCLVLTAALMIPVFFFYFRHPFKPAYPIDAPPVDRARAKLRGIILLLFVMHWMALLMCFFSIAGALTHLMLKASNAYLGIILPAALPGLFFISIYFWLRPKQSLYAEDRAEEDVRAQDLLKHWKLGAFYWNPANPSHIVPRRFGTGYTLNFATRRAWVYLGFILFPMIFLFTTLAIISFVLSRR